MQKIVPNLWFTERAEEAVEFYVSIFKNSKILETAYYPEAAEEVLGQKAGSVMTVLFELDGQQFLALNGGPAFKFNEAVSFIIYCDTQDEIDYYWEKLSAVPEAEQCGWLKDKYGLSWQVAPRMLDKLMLNPETSNKATKAFLKMKKIDIAELEKAVREKV